MWLYMFRHLNHMWHAISAELLITSDEHLKLRKNLILRAWTCELHMTPVFIDEFFDRIIGINLHYEAKLIIMCIVSGFRSTTKTDLSRNMQLCYFSLIFFAVLEQIPKTLYRSKSLQK